MLSTKFVVPKDPKDLEQRTDNLAGVSDVPDISTLSAADIYSMAEELIQELEEQEPLELNSQSCLNRTYAVIRCWKNLTNKQKYQLLNALCDCLKAVSASASVITQSSTSLGQQHANSITIALFFIHWISSSPEENEESIRKPAKGRVSKKTTGKPQKPEGNEWSWKVASHSVLTSFALAFKQSFAKLFSPLDLQQAMQLPLLLALREMERDDIPKDGKDAFKPAFMIISELGTTQNLAALVTEAVMASVRSNNDMPQVAADLAQFCSLHHNSDILAVGLIQAFTSVDPADYSEEAGTVVAPVKRAAEMIQCLAKSLPWVVSGLFSMLQPYFGCQASNVRSCLVSALGEVIKSLVRSDDGESNREAHVKRVTTKRHCMDLLMERVLDKAAYTRLRALNVLKELAAEGHVDPDLWPTLLEEAVLRLTDSSKVAKGAVGLIGIIVYKNPFTRVSLDPETWLCTLQQKEEQLQTLPRDEGGEEDDDEDQGPGSDTGRAQATAEHDQANVDPSSSTTGVSQADPQYEDSPIESATQLMEPTQPSESPRQPLKGSSPTTTKSREQLRVHIANCKLAVKFTQALQACMRLLERVLKSESSEVLTETIYLIVSLKENKVPGADALMKNTWPLVYSRHPVVRDAVVDATFNVYLSHQLGLKPYEQALCLVCLRINASVGQLACLTEIIRLICAEDATCDGKYKLRSEVVSHLIKICLDGIRDMKAQKQDEQSDAFKKAQELARSSMDTIADIATHNTALIHPHIGRVLGMLRDAALVLHDALVVQHAARALMALCPVAADAGQESHAAANQCCQILLQVLLDMKMQDAEWYTAAQSALTAFYCISRQPSVMLVQVLDTMYTNAAGSSLCLAHFFFLVGQCALQELKLVDDMLKRIRKVRGAPGANKGSKQTQDEDAEDIASQVGMGVVTAEAELEAVKESAELQILDADSVVGRYAGVLSSLCSSHMLLTVAAHLRCAAITALTQLMIADAAFCEDHMQLLFSLLKSSAVEDSIRCNIVVALGDIACRHPNIMEPWTAFMYSPLLDHSLDVRLTGLKAVSFLIMNDMMKVKGQIGKVALCLKDSEPRVSEWAEIFFSTLSTKTQGHSNPLSNHLGDILSVVIAQDLPFDTLTIVMEKLLAFVKDKSAESAKEKLCVRFEHASVYEARAWAWCLQKLGYSEKGLRIIMAAFSSYASALGDLQVFQAFQKMAEHGRKSASGKPELKEAVLEWEAKLKQAHDNFCEQAPTATHAETPAAAETGPAPEQSSSMSQSGHSDSVVAASRQSIGASGESPVMQIDDVSTSGAVEHQVYVKAEPVDADRAVDAGTSTIVGRRLRHNQNTAMIKPEPGLTHVSQDDLNDDLEDDLYEGSDRAQFNDAHVSDDDEGDQEEEDLASEGESEKGSAEGSMQSAVSSPRSTNASSFSDDESYRSTEESDDAIDEMAKSMQQMQV